MADAGTGLGPLAVGLLTTAGPIAGAVVAAVVGHFTRRDERTHEDRRRVEERENEARIRAEDHAAALERTRLEHEAAASDKREQLRDAERQRRADAAKVFLVEAHKCLQTLRRADEGGVGDAQWHALSAGLGEVTAAFNLNLAMTADFAVDALQRAQRETDDGARGSLLGEVERDLWEFAESAQQQDGSAA